LFCKGDEPIIDSFLAVSIRGRLAVPALSSLAHAKRLVKQTPVLMQFVQMLRGILHR
jgi:CelD/BcsL family acetyltransferase involved in cellulose biosynthesis